MSYDERCEELAGVFLMNAQPHINNRDNEVALAQVIQDAIEDFLREKEASESALGEAYGAGMEAAFKIVNRRSGPENRRQTDIGKPPDGTERRRNGKNACDGRRKDDDGIPF